MDTNSKAILERSAEWSRLIDAKDIDGIVNLYRTDGVFLVPGIPASEGHQAIRATLESLFNLPGFALALNPIVVDVSGDASFATERGSYRLSYRNSEDPVVEIGKYLVVWRASSDGTWKVAADMINSDGPTVSA